MSLEDNMMPGYFDSIAALSKQMDRISNTFPQSSAIEAAIRSNQIFHEKFAWVDDLNKRLEAFNYAHQVSNKFQFYEAALRLDSIASIGVSNAIKELHTNYRFDLDVLKETTYEFNPDYWSEIRDDDIEAFPEVDTTNGAPLYLTEGQQVKSIIESVWRENQELYQMKPRDFERMAAELLKYQGFEVELTKQTRDGGCDIYAIFKIAGSHPIKILVECKRYREDRKIGVGIVRQLRDVTRQDNFNKGLLLTTSFLTKDSKQEISKTPWLLDYKDKNHILDWIRDYKGIIIT